MKKLVIYLRDRVTKSDVYILSLPIRYYISERHKLYLIQHDVDTKVAKSLKPVRNKILLTTGIGLTSSLLTRDGEPILTRDGKAILVNHKRNGVMKTIFDKSRFLLQLESEDSNIHSNKIVYDIGNKLFIKNDVASAVRELIEKIPHKTWLKSGIGITSHLLTRDGIPVLTKDGRLIFVDSQRTDSIIRTLYAGGDNKSILTTGIGLTSSLLTRDGEPILTRDGKAILVNHKRPIGSTDVMKTAKFIHDIYLAHNVNPLSEKLSETTDNIMNISSAVARVDMTRYRTLGDMDSDGSSMLTLSQFDALSLEDIDYIII